MCLWPTLLNAEPDSETIFSNYGMPSLSKVTSYHCNILSCMLMAQVPQLTEGTKYPTIKLIGLEEIINGTQVVPIGHHRTI